MEVIITSVEEYAQGLWGSNSYILTTSLPGPLVGNAPHNITRPFSGVLVYNLSLYMVLVNASKTWFLVVSDFMLDAVPYSSLSVAITSYIGLPCGMYRDINSVPLPFFYANSLSIRLNLYSFTELCLLTLTYIIIIDITGILLYSVYYSICMH